jgi:hypothetical protein
MRAYVVALSLLLGACSTSPDLDIPAYKPPGAPGSAAIARGTKQAAGEEKLKGPLEVSEVRPTDHGPGPYFVCVREANPSSGKLQTYSAFFSDDTYKGVRQSVLMEDCGTQSYTPMADVPAPAATPAPVPPPLPHQKRR